jgi:hypothetical protein
MITVMIIMTVFLNSLPNEYRTKVCKMNAWINATKTSIKYINVAKAIETGEKPHLHLC